VGALSSVTTSGRAGPVRGAGAPRVPYEAMMTIAGREVDGKVRVAVRDPADPAAVVGSAPDGTRADVEAAVAAAAGAFREWRGIDLADRAGALAAAADRLETTSEQRAQLLVREQGKVLAEARREVDVMTAKLRQMAAEGPALLEAQQWEAKRHRSQLLRQPRGPVAAVVPWNSPISLLASKLAAALLSGNTVVAKVPSECPLTALASVAAIADLFPSGAVNTVCGTVDEVGEPLVTHPEITTVSFTGSVASGRRIATVAAPMLKRLILELGGNDPAIILDDVVLDAPTVRNLVWGFCMNAGQICMAIRRLYVQRDVVGAVVAAIRENLGGLTIGPGLDEGSDIGPLQNRAAWQRFRALLERTEAAGAHIEEHGRLSPSANPEGFFVRPTLVHNASEGSEIVDEEQFGPAVPILPFDQIDEAVARANASSFGLSSSVWSGDDERAWQIAARLETGLTFVNDHGLNGLDRRLPYGGMKASGLGREGGPLSCLEYVEYHGITNAHLLAPPSVPSCGPSTTGAVAASRPAEKEE
jgi:aldehyde dehydrogenase